MSNDCHFEPPNREAGKWRAVRGETSIIPKAQNRANHCKIAHFRIFSCIFSPAENRAENAWFCGGFAGFSRKMCGFGRYAAVPNRLGAWVGLAISDFPVRIAKRLPARNNWRILRNPNYRNSPGVPRLRCRKCPIISIPSRPTVRPKMWRAASGETSIIPKAQNRANRCKIAHFRIFSCIFSSAENRAENAWFCGGFDGFSRKMCGFGRYAAVPNAIWEHGRD